MVWLSFNLQEKELSIKRLRAIFGIKTESAKKLLEIAKGKNPNSKKNKTSRNISNSNNDDEVEGNDVDEYLETGSSKDKTGKHGHRPSSDYTEAKLIDIVHESLKKGCLCPFCSKGKFFQLKPRTNLRIVGQPCFEWRFTDRNVLDVIFAEKYLMLNYPWNLQ